MVRETEGTNGGREKIEREVEIQRGKKGGEEKDVGGKKMGKKKGRL